LSLNGISGIGSAYQPLRPDNIQNGDQANYHDFQNELYNQFDICLKKLAPAPGLPEGVFAVNRAPDQTINSLNISTRIV